jgi:2-oxoglutarate ferredoxin oxidoreductase subunit beta
MSIHDVKHIIETKKAIREAFQIQVEDRGFGIVEILATCPTQWKLDPVKSMERIVEKVIPYYPLGVFSSRKKED